MIGVPDERFGQRLVAFVVARPGSDIDVPELREYLKSRVSRFEQPRDINVVDRIPRNPTGKVLRRSCPAEQDRPAPYSRRSTALAVAGPRDHSSAGSNAATCLASQLGASAEITVAPAVEPSTPTRRPDPGACSRRTG